MRLGGVGRNWSWWLGLLSTEDLTCGAVTVIEIIMVPSLPARDFLVLRGWGESYLCFVQSLLSSAPRKSKIKSFNKVQHMLFWRESLLTALRNHKFLTTLQPLLTFPISAPSTTLSQGLLQFSGF